MAATQEIKMHVDAKEFTNSVGVFAGLIGSAQLAHLAAVLYDRVPHGGLTNGTDHEKIVRAVDVAELILEECAKRQRKETA